MGNFNVNEIREYKVQNLLKYRYDEYQAMGIIPKSMSLSEFENQMRESTEDYIDTNDLLDAEFDAMDEFEKQQAKFNDKNYVVDNLKRRGLWKGNDALSVEHKDNSIDVGLRQHKVPDFDIQEKDDTDSEFEY